MKQHVTKSVNVVQKLQLRLVRIHSSGWFTTVRIKLRSSWCRNLQLWSSVAVNWQKLLRVSD